MKKTILTFFAIFTTIAAFAQTETKPATDSSAGKIHSVFGDPGKLGWWVSPDFAYTKLDSRDAYMMGISGGIIVKHSFSIGLAGYGIINSHNLRYSNINDTADVYLYGGYGGLKIEYRLMPLNMINIAFPLLIGGGGVSYSTWGADDWNTNHHDPNYNYDNAYIWDSFFVLEPGVVVGVNLLKFMRFDAGVSYRFASNINLPKTDSQLMNNFNTTLSLKFGKF